MTTNRVRWIFLCAGAFFSACKPEVPLEPPKAEQAVQTIDEDVTLKKTVAAPNIAATSPAPGSEQNPSVAAADKGVLGSFSINRESVLPGTEITKKGTHLKLTGTPLKVGSMLPLLKLTDASSGKVVLTSSLKGKVLLISVVPAVATPVCTMQSKYLESGWDGQDTNIALLTVSRDSKEALEAFAQTTGARHAMYLSDRDFGTFGAATGLGVEGADILARSVIVVDETGVVRYVQVVPELTELPDMDKAFATARELATHAI